MRTFKVKFLHTDNSVREIEIQAFNRERAEVRFFVNWSLDMKILSILLK